MSELAAQFCTAIVVEDLQGRVLLLRRAPGRGRLGGLWHLPGGRHGPGESDTDCAIRELVEETGLSAIHLEYLATTYTGGLVGVVFRAESVSGAASIGEPDIHDQLGWFDPSDPPSPLFSGTAEVLVWLRQGRVVAR